MTIDIAEIAGILDTYPEIIEERFTEWKARQKNGTVKVDLKFLAALSGLSVTSVSNIVNKKQGSASRENREKILALAAHLQYVPLVSARLLNSSKKRSVAFVAPITGGSSTDFYIEVLKGVQQSARAFQYSVAIYDISFEEEKKFYARMPFWGMVDGIISVSSTADGADIDALVEKKMPVIHINPRNRISRLPVVHAVETNYDGFSRLLERVLGVHCPACPVLIVANPENYYQRREQIELFRQKLTEHSLPYSFEKNVVVTPSYLIRDSIECIKTLFERKQQFDAVFCLSDMVAVAVMAECRKYGLHLPVTGYANLPISALFDATTVDERLNLLGQTAFEKMIITLNQLEINKRLPEYGKTVIQTLPIFRGSCLS